MEERYELSQAIKAAGLTQEAFARLVGDDLERVSLIARGVMHPDPLRKIKWAGVLGKSVSELWPTAKSTL